MTTNMSVSVTVAWWLRPVMFGFALYAFVMCREVNITAFNRIAVHAVRVRIERPARDAKAT